MPCCSKCERQQTNSRPAPGSPVRAGRSAFGVRMPRALKTCARPGCPNLVPSGRCDGCAKQGDRERGTSWQRGYRTAHRNGFRPAVLLRDPVCVCDQAGQHGHGERCYRASTVADHWPMSKRELIERGMDSDDPKHGRGLCAQCHGSETTVHQPGGWNAR